jgi:hypothetical protein
VLLRLPRLAYARIALAEAATSGRMPAPSALAHGCEAVVGDLLSVAIPPVIWIGIVTFMLDRSKLDLESNQREADRELGVLHRHETAIDDVACDRAESRRFIGADRNHEDAGK